MDKLIIKGGSQISGSVNVHGSKNAALPIIVSSLLSDKILKLSNVPNVVDVLNLIKLLKNYGIKIEYKKDKLKINPSKIKNISADYDVVRKMRASILILGPLLSRFGEARISLPGGCAIGTRPIDIHLTGLSKLGANFDIQNGFVVGGVTSQLIGNKIKLPFPSVGATENILMASVLAKGETKIVNAAREPEIEDLSNCLIKMGAKIEGQGTKTILVQGVTNLKKVEHQVISDRIVAGTYIIAALMLNSSLEIKNFNTVYLKSLINILKKMGAKLKVNNNSIKVFKGSKLKSTSLSTSPYPGFPTDLQAQLMSLMCLSDGKSKIKETIFENRFMHVPELNRLGANITVEKDTATIIGNQTFKGAQVMASDLRASISLVLAAMNANGQTILNRVYHLDRGYENIEKTLGSLGAKIKRQKN
ncbi:UDP-N-acetylglucosamine 1-carboxyvinyltransferase [Pelagibacteraceae bacterium]|nr:UDP-N-acetylglucosamine 1-carboxyvinyltransferase [Pelagibacteraceae bacterium]